MYYILYIIGKNKYNNINREIKSKNNKYINCIYIYIYIYYYYYYYIYIYINNRNINTEIQKK